MMRAHFLTICAALVLTSCGNGDVGSQATSSVADIAEAGWPESSGSKGGGQYSPLTEINRTNLDRLQIAWTYSSPDAIENHPAVMRPNMVVEATPILVDDKLVSCTSVHRVFALDALTGKRLWDYDPKVSTEVPSYMCRGVASWQDSRDTSGKACSKRIYSTSGDGRLFALDLQTGVPCTDFGTGGTVDMRQGLGAMKINEYYNSAPPLVVGDIVLANAAVRDGFRTDAPGGVLRAWDARTGKLVWAWDPVGSSMRAVSAEDVAGGQTFTRGTPNIWTFMSADVERGLIFVSTGNAPPEHFKGNERDIDTYGSAVVALSASTGQVVWHFQTVHHDIWDYDIAGQPVLYEDAKGTPALAVATKQGFIFLLNRVTGEPLFPVEERPVPQTDVPGEWTAPTQPFPTLPQPLFTTEALTEDDLNWMPIVTAGCKETLAQVRNEGIFTPPSIKGTLQNPGIAGGFGWGSGAINPQSRILIATYLNLPFIVALEARTEEGSPDTDNRPFNFTNLPQYESPYVAKRRPFLSHKGVPCIAYPWGSIVAINIDTGRTLWKKPLGSMRGRVPLIGSYLDVGMPVAGGALQTGSGLVFVGASSDETLRVLDAANGEELWKTHLPFSAHATPMSFKLKSGKQFIVVATGGSLSLDTKAGDRLVAFTLRD